ncbi:hypothetical protein ACWGKS_26970 [Nocardiopsis sp. NPDC055879]
MTEPRPTFTRGQIADMDTDEYAANREAIMAQLKREGTARRTGNTPTNTTTTPTE